MNLPGIAYVDIASNLLPLGIGVARIRSIRRERWYFFLFVAAAAITELVTYWMATQRIHNLWLLQWYNIIEYGSLILLFAAWQKNAIIRKSLIWSNAVFLVLWVWFKVTGIEKLTDPAEYTHTISSVTLVIASMIALVDLMKEETSSIYREARFWISSSVLIYFAGNIILFLFSTSLSALNLQAFSRFGTLHWGIDIACNFMYAIAFLCFPKNP